MRKLFFAAIALGLAACSGPHEPVDLNDGFVHLSKGGTYDCTAQPVAFDGDHADVTLRGSCARVRVSGWHVDLTAYVPPGAVIVVTGSHDDIVYRLIAPGPAPRWIDTGKGNTLLRNSRVPSERDHDWYQERH